MKVYIDTSFLIALYSADANSEAAALMMHKAADEFWISTFGELEAVNALELRVFRKEISREQAQASWDELVKDLRAGILQVKELPDQVFGRALLLSRKTTARLGTRSADLLHVATALELGADALYSFDQMQRKLAQSVRLKLN